MKFGARPLDEAVGKILAHNVADRGGKRLLRKGKVLTEADLEQIRALGRSRLYVAELQPGDVPEDQAAARVARALIGQGVECRGAVTGRTNIFATGPGLLHVLDETLPLINSLAGVTLATLRSPAVVAQAQMVATVKIIPYALSGAQVSRAEQLATQNGPVVSVRPLVRRQVAIILHGSRRVEAPLKERFVPPLEQRLQRWGSEVGSVGFVAFEADTDELELEGALKSAVGTGAELIIIAGETAIMDQEDIIPTAVRRSGGRVECVGAPVDPGNLMMLAYLDGVPILGAPGCASSPKENVVDWVIPRLLSGDVLRGADIAALGHGGLLAEIHERPMPRRSGEAR